jgi:tetratricopeptide (TPR) repeat protein
MRTLLIALLAALAPAAASASTMVFGSDSASQCARSAILGRTDTGSEEWCDRALHDDMLNTDDRAKTLVNRGVMKLGRGDYEAARADFEAALALMPKLPEAFLNRGAAWLGEHKYQLAIADLGQAIDLGTAQPEKAYYDRALAYEGLDNEKSAYFDYLKAVELKPGWLLPQHELTRFHVSPGPATPPATSQTGS